MSESVFWFRRDLRWHDNAGLHAALKAGPAVRPIFIFDSDILGHLSNPRDTRVPFLHDRVLEIKDEFRKRGSDLEVFYGTSEEIFKGLLSANKNKIVSVYTNHDYEPSAMRRDEKIRKMCEAQNVGFETFKDHVVFEKEEILTQGRKPYTVYTPYKKTWLHALSPFYLKCYPTEDYLMNLKKVSTTGTVPSLTEMGFDRTVVPYPPALLPCEILRKYADQRDFPAIEGTSRLGLHLRFGTLSIRDLAREAKELSAVWLSELVWRDFFIQILFHYPHVEKNSFRPEYDKVAWRENTSEFNRWSEGTTGYPMVDAGMRELNATGYMHNRVRMVTASFLCKHLLMYWLKGERDFAGKLLDYELAVNNGNWQWAAGTGCDAAPYFRVFNPQTQREKFDPKDEYIKKWIPELGTSRYPKPMVDHKEARDRALLAFAVALKGKNA